MNKNHILKEYSRIIKEELKIKSNSSYDWDPWVIRHVTSDANMIYGYTMQIAEIAKSSLLPRSYNAIYGLDNRTIAYESVGAHTNLMSALVDRALTFIYGPDFGDPNSKCPYTIDNFSYREIMEAVRLHDLPENEIGDWPDNDTCDRNKKAVLEQKFLQKFQSFCPGHGKHFSDNEKVIRLTSSMDTHKYPTGNLLKVADKAAALLITLCYDSIGKSPKLHVNTPCLSKRDIKEMEICGSKQGGYRKASEMWAVDYFKLRKFNELDSSNFLTAIIIMYTLIVNGHWYAWREKDYNS